MKRIMLSFGLLCVLLPATYGKTAKDSAAAALNSLSAAYHKKLLDEKSYLDSMYALSRAQLSNGISFGNKELLDLLSTYRTLAWGGKDFEKYRRNYYAILANQAQMGRREGEMLYYGEKIDALEQATNHRPSLTALSIITGFYQTHLSFSEIVASYKKAASYLQSVPELAARKELKVEELVQASIVFSRVVMAYYHLKDTLAGDKLLSMIRRIETLAREKYQADDNVMANIRLPLSEAYYQQALEKKDDAGIRATFTR